MASKFHSAFQVLFENADAGATSPEFKWPGGHLEILAEGATFGGMGVSLEIETPSGVFIPVNALFIRQNGSVNGFACPGTFRASLGIGASNVSAWFVGIAT